MENSPAPDAPEPSDEPELMDTGPITPPDTKIWSALPESFPKNDNHESVAELNDFEPNDHDTTPQQKSRGVTFAGVLNDDNNNVSTRKTSNQTIPISPRLENFMMKDKNSRFHNARNSLFVHRDGLRRDSEEVRNDDEYNSDEEDQQIPTFSSFQGFQNPAFQNDLDDGFR